MRSRCGREVRRCDVVTVERLCYLLFRRTYTFSSILGRRTHSISIASSKRFSTASSAVASRAFISSFFRSPTRKSKMLRHNAHADQILGRSDQLNASGMRAVLHSLLRSTNPIRHRREHEQDDHAGDKHSVLHKHSISALRQLRTLVSAQPTPKLTRGDV
jgi:hypothetical protein